MRPEKQNLIDYLMTKTRGALVMTPDELALEIRVSAKQQSKLRRERNFPIPHQKAGRSVYYSLYAVAAYLMDGVTLAPELEPVAAVAAPRQTGVATKLPRKARQQPEDMSQLFMLRNLVKSLEEQKQILDPVLYYFSAYIKAAPLAEKLESVLEVKHAKVPKPSVRKA